MIYTLLCHAERAPVRSLPETDWPLSAAGRTAASNLVPLLATLRLRALYASPTARTLALASAGSRRPSANTNRKAPSSVSTGTRLARSCTRSTRRLPMKTGHQCPHQRSIVSRKPTGVPHGRHRDLARGPDLIIGPPSPRQNKPHEPTSFQPLLAAL